MDPKEFEKKERGSGTERVIDIDEIVAFEWGYWSSVYHILNRLLLILV
jgi:hypothetical protein